MDISTYNGHIKSQNKNDDVGLIVSLSTDLLQNIGLLRPKTLHNRVVLA